MAKQRLRACAKDGDIARMRSEGDKRMKYVQENYRFVKEQLLITQFKRPLLQINFIYNELFNGATAI